MIFIFRVILFWLCKYSSQLNHYSMLWLSFLSYIIFSSIPLFCFPHSLIFNIFVRLSHQKSEKTSDFSQLYKIPVNDLKTIDNLLISSFWGTFYQRLLNNSGLDWLLSRFAVQVSSCYLPSPFPGVPFLFPYGIGSSVSWIPYLSLLQRNLLSGSLGKDAGKINCFGHCMSEKIFYLHTWCGWLNYNFVMISP